MNNHQSLKAEIDARDENFTICVNLGKDLLARRHQRSQEVGTMLRIAGYIAQSFYNEDYYQCLFICLGTRQTCAAWNK